MSDAAGAYLSDTYGADEMNPAGAVSQTVNAGDSIEVERIPAGDDTDSLTRQTVAKMCEYIRDGIADPNVQMCMGAAVQHLARGRTDPFSLAWAVFWFLRHRVKKVQDEAALFRLGEPDQADMLISPAVLVRMADAQEDCDGFTMLAAAMLGACSGVEQCIVTVACDLRDRARWSHVFGMIKLPNGEWLPLDCHTGQGPGWMVPRNRINRWQAWDLNGNPIQVEPPIRSTLHGYVYRGRDVWGRRNGLGQDEGDDSIDTSGITTGPTQDQAGLDLGITTGPTLAQAGESSATLTFPGMTSTPAAPLPAGYATATPTTPSSSASSANIASILNSLFSGGTKIATAANLPAGYTLNAAGQVVPIGLSAANLGPLLLLAGGGLVVFMVISAMGQK